MHTTTTTKRCVHNISMFLSYAAQGHRHIFDLTITDHKLLTKNAVHVERATIDVNVTAHGIIFLFCLVSLSPTPFNIPQHFTQSLDPSPFSLSVLLNTINKKKRECNVKKITTTLLF